MIILDQRPPYLDVAALGNHAVWAVVCYHLITRRNIDLHVIPQHQYPELVEIWREMIGPNVVEKEDIDCCVEYAKVHGGKHHAPSRKDKVTGRGKKTIIENAFCECGFKYENDIVACPQNWPHDPYCRNILIYPIEHTQCNRFYGIDYWLHLLQEIGKRGWKVHILGTEKRTRRGGERAQHFFIELCKHHDFEHIWEPTISQLKEAVSHCSLAIGTSTGPTWALLASSIPQIVIERQPHNQALWSVLRNAPLIEKAKGLWHIYKDRDTSFLNKLDEVSVYRPLLPDPLSPGSPAMPKHLSIHFEHGLGDTANFCRLIKLYQNHGYTFDISAPANKHLLFKAVGANIVDHAPVKHPWLHPHISTALEPGRRGWMGNKTGANINRSVLPSIGDIDQLWEELKGITIRPDYKVSLSEHPRFCEISAHSPIVLLHTIGNSCQGEKSIPINLHFELYRKLIEKTSATLILLDWDRRMPKTNHARILHIEDIFGHPATTEELTCLIYNANLTIGVDSGPLHYAAAMGLPSIGMFRPRHYASSYLVPSRNTLSIVPRNRLVEKYTRYKRFEWNIVEYGGGDVDSGYLDLVAQLAQDMLNLGVVDFGNATAAEATQFFKLTELTRGNNSNGLSEVCDRNISFDQLFCIGGDRFEHPRIVETGCIRSEEDWAGAGASTLLFARYAQLKGGTLTSVDTSPKNLAFADKWTRQFKGVCHFAHGRGEDYLRSPMSNQEPIDILYLDSVDANEPGHAEANLAEFQAAQPHLSPQALVLIDDTPTNGRGQFIGKGALTVPHALQNGWRILYAGYQVLLTRSNAQ